MPLDLRRAQPTRPRSIAWLLGSLALLLVLLTLVVATSWAPLFRLDHFVAQHAYDVAAGHAWFIGLLKGIAFWLGPWALRIVLLVCAGVAYARRERRIALWLVVVVVAETVVAPLSKFVLHRDRPFWDRPITPITGYSFPSGHASAAGMLGTTLILLTIVLVGRGLMRRLLVTAWVLLAVVIAADRVYLGVHYLSDVVTGLAFGTLVALVSWVAAMANAVGETAPQAVVTGTGSKRLAVVLNPTKVADVALFRQRLNTAAARADWAEPLWFETLEDDPGAAMTEKALAAGVDLVIAAGGDGTVRLVCSELARTGVAVGVVPLGTGNLLARNLAIPLHIGDAIDNALGGQDRAVDIVSISGDSLEPTSFTVMAGLGFDAAVMTGTRDDLKAKVGWIAYVVSGVQQLFSFPTTRVQISVDGEPFVRRRVLTVIIGNVGFLQGGLPLLPDAVIDDGMLDVVVLAPPHKTGFVGVALRLFARGRRTDERLDRMTGREVVIRADRPTPMQLDGDPIGEGRELRAEIQPGVLLVRVPHGR